MKKVLIVTKTNWREAPRIRHQVTRLLRDAGYQITFIEKNAYKNLFIRHRHQEGIEFYAHAELIHHQLRYFPFIQWLNNFVVKYYLRKITKRLEFDFVMNFCYDYHFLKSLFPGKKVITMIEDDFESQAKFGMTRQIRNQVAKTCRNSDVVLTVSFPLLEKLRQHNPNVKMLFPWSQQRYKQPVASSTRNTVLYFGYVHRLDWATIERLVRETPYHYRFIGPTAKHRDNQMVDHLARHYQNFEYIPFSPVSNLRVDDVFCSILPYDANIKSVQACTVSNRAFNLLALGMPLAYADLKSLIAAPTTVIRKNASIGEYKETLAFFKENFNNVQNDIAEFLSNHYEDSRWQVLEEAINKDVKR